MSGDDFGTITITQRLADDGEHLVSVNFGGLTVIEVFGMLEMARLHVIEGALGLRPDDDDAG